MPKALLVLQDGFYLEGESFGASGTFVGEVCFNTSMSGYQEILTDPSYRGQLVTLTYPQIGNYGVNGEDSESESPQAAGLIIRSLAVRPSNWRASESLEQYLVRHGVGAIHAVDTRALVLHIREKGALNGVLTTERMSVDEASLLAQDYQYGAIDFVGQVTTKEPYLFDEQGKLSKIFGDRDLLPEPKVPVAFLDYGTKKNILRSLRRRGFRCYVFPARTNAAEILASGARAVFLSNGPGDPAVLDYAVDTVRGLVGKLPIYGICLGHQIIARALGGSTYKLKFGHRGANHPVKELASGRILITSQNHGYAVDEKTLPAGVQVTHVNLNDGTCAGLRFEQAQISAVQFHPEACPGPRDAELFFDAFARETGEKSKP